MIIGPGSYLASKGTQVALELKPRVIYLYLPVPTCTYLYLPVPNCTYLTVAGNGRYSICPKFEMSCILVPLTVGHTGAQVSTSLSVALLLTSSVTSVPQFIPSVTIV